MRDEGGIELGSYLDASGAQIIALTRLRRLQRADAFFREKYGETRRASRKTAYHDKLRAAGVAYPKPPRPHDRYISLEVHDRLFQFQDGCCYLCDGAFTDTDWATQDHVVPRAAGGKDSGNVLLAHALCNQIKDERMPTAEELAYLARIKAMFGALCSKDRGEATFLAPAWIGDAQRDGDGGDLEALAGLPG